MSDYVQTGNLRVARVLYDLLIEEIIPGIDVDADAFWQSFDHCLSELGPENQALLQKRDQLQAKIDDWHQQREGKAHDPVAYKSFLKDIGYLLAESDDFSITTEKVDAEISSIAGPQLVVPVMNTRYALNAANARWGSLYDSLYGSNVIEESDETELGDGYNPVRGEKVVTNAANFLNVSFPLNSGKHEDVVLYSVVQGQLRIDLSQGGVTELVQPEQFVGYTGEPDQPSMILLRNHGLHAELQIDRQDPIGKAHSAGIKDIILEAAISSVQDFEDSVAAVDAEDKVIAYRNWLGLMKGDLSASLQKDGKIITRQLNPDRQYIAPNGETFSLPGRSLLLVRNVGHHMYTDAVLDNFGDPVPEGMLDGFITSLIALHDLKRTGPYTNSATGSIYITKPKMHGPEEVALTNSLFGLIEDALSLPRYTIKMGIMDEERRTSLNLKECIRAAKDRVVFINTGFLDRTGDEIHTSMLAGPMVPKTDMKHTDWIKAYEDFNVDVGLDCGLQGKAQIGKGMWAMPDEMYDMLQNKVNHPLAGANTAWVPSPTAAVLHALHYHQVDVFEQQNRIKRRPHASVDNMLKIPLLESSHFSSDEIQQELDNNIQGILGYVVRWVEQGIGCSKVPDIHDIGLMEDRATLRISSQHVANWLLHRICTQQQVVDTLKRMAQKVDAQNRDDPTYRNMAPDFNNSQAFQAARDLIFKGTEQANGYTEAILNEYRRKAKAALSR